MLEIDNPHDNNQYESKSDEIDIKTIKAQIPISLHVNIINRTFKIYQRLLDNIGGRLPQDYFDDYLPPEEY